MMTIKEAAAKAFRTQDAALAGRVSDQCRFNLGMNYKATQRLFKRADSQCDEHEFEALMYEADRHT